MAIVGLSGATTENSSSSLSPFLARKPALRPLRSIIAPMPKLAIKFLMCFACLRTELVAVRGQSHSLQKPSQEQQEYTWWVKSDPFDDNPYVRPDPAVAASWDINTVEDEWDPKIWLLFKRKFNIERDFYVRYNLTNEESDKILRRLWTERVLMLKLKYRCLDYQDRAYAINRDTIRPVLDHCDNDLYMCANQQRPLLRRQFDWYLAHTVQTNIRGHGNDGFNKYTLLRTIYGLQLDQNAYRICRGIEPKEPDIKAMLELPEAPQEPTQVPEPEYFQRRAP